MPNWTAEELEAVDGGDELRIAGRRADGTLRKPVPIWVVRVGDDLYARAAYGPRTGWHRTALASGEARVWAAGIDTDVQVVAADASVWDAVDAAYGAKYGGRYAEHIVASVVGDEARASTVRFSPQS